MTHKAASVDGWGKNRTEIRVQLNSKKSNNYKNSSFKNIKSSKTAYNKGIVPLGTLLAVEKER
jgi:hypothetical protein